MSEKKKTSVEVPQDVDSAAQNAINKSAASGANRKQLILWMGALVLGGILGFMGSELLNEFFNFVATVFTKLFQAVAIPTIALSIITTLCKYFKVSVIVVVARVFNVFDSSSSDIL